MFLMMVPGPYGDSRLCVHFVELEVRKKCPPKFLIIFTLGSRGGPNCTLFDDFENTLQFVPQNKSAIVQWPAQVMYPQ